MKGSVIALGILCAASGWVLSGPFDGNSLSSRPTAESNEDVLVLPPLVAPTPRPVPEIKAVDKKPSKSLLTRPLLLFREITHDGHASSGRAGSASDRSTQSSDRPRQASY